MSDKNIEKKLDLILEEVTSLKNSFIERGYITDTRIPPLHQEMYKKAKEIVLRTRKASTSLLQRELKLGYANAARIMDELEDEGVIGPANGAVPRKVL
ncbi:MAG TPA: DNA translocase FtsK [Candidatus Magasanikbacteria bacterium]|nr:DNA translocase FtsK [Candidatus Magasanikbacteria bacterium]